MIHLHFLYSTKVIIFLEDLNNIAIGFDLDVTHLADVIFNS